SDLRHRCGPAETMEWRQPYVDGFELRGAHAVAESAELVLGALALGRVLDYGHAYIATLGGHDDDAIAATILAHLQPRLLVLDALWIAQALDARELRHRRTDREPLAVQEAADV